MSKVKIQGNAGGTGTITIAAPSTNTDRTLTLPDAGGEILTGGSSLPAANLTGTLPAIDGSNLTGVGGGVWEIAESWTPTEVNSKDFTLDFDTYSEYKVYLDNVGSADDYTNFYMTFRADSGATAVGNIAYHLREGATDTTETATATSTNILLSALYGYDAVGGDPANKLIETISGFLNIHQHKHDTGSAGAYAFYNNKSYTYGDAQFIVYTKTVATDEPTTNKIYKYGARANAATDPRIDTVRFYFNSTYVFRASQGKIILYGLKKAV